MISKESETNPENYKLSPNPKLKAYFTLFSQILQFLQNGKNLWKKFTPKDLTFQFYRRNDFPGSWQQYFKIILRRSFIIDYSRGVLLLIPDRAKFGASRK